MTMITNSSSVPHKLTHEKVAPFQNDPQVVDIMAVDNLPNELPRDASKYFGGFLLTYVIPDLLSNPQSAMLKRATICEDGKLTDDYSYLHDYAYVNPVE
jgi:hypothetical protein